VGATGGRGFVGATGGRGFVGATGGRGFAGAADGRGFVDTTARARLCDWIASKGLPRPCESLS